MNLLLSVKAQNATSRKPPAVKAAVIAKYVEGKQKASIARELGVDRETVTRILNEPDIRDAVDASRRRVLELLPKAESAVEMQLDKGDDRRTPLALSKDATVSWPGSTTREGKDR